MVEGLFNSFFLMSMYLSDKVMNQEEGREGGINIAYKLMTRAIALVRARSARSAL